MHHASQSPSKEAHLAGAVEDKMEEPSTAGIRLSLYLSIYQVRIVVSFLELLLTHWASGWQRL